MSFDNQHIESTECAWEERVAAAVGDHDLEDAVRAHLGECASCRATVDAIRLLAEDGRTEVLRSRERVPAADALIALAGPDLFAGPAPARRWSPALVEQVLRPVVWIERGAIAIAAAAFFLILAWIEPHQSATAVSGIGDVLQTTTVSEADPSSTILALAALLILAIAAHGLTGSVGLRPQGTLLTPRGR